MEMIVVDIKWHQFRPGERRELLRITARRTDVRPGAPKDFDAVFYCGRAGRIPPHCLESLGLTAEQLRQGKPKAGSLQEFVDWCGDDCIIGFWGWRNMDVLKETLKQFRVEKQWKGCANLKDFFLIQEPPEEEESFPQIAPAFLEETYRKGGISLDMLYLISRERKTRAEAKKQAQKLERKIKRAKLLRDAEKAEQERLKKMKKSRRNKKSGKAET